jgi:2-keto-3-deoxy-L-rhamnonate aldolase RhmA
MKKNRLKELLKEGKPTLGTRVIIPWPRVVEAIGEVGLFDYIEYGAHSSNWTYEILENMSRAFDLYPNMSSLIKCIPEERTYLAPRAVDTGFQNIKFSSVRSAEEVRECIRLVKPETEGGEHGFDPRRIGMGRDSRNEWAKAMKEVGIWVVIERKSAMDEIDEILSIPDIDMVSMGNNDYGISIGKPSKSPEVKKAERELIEKAHKAGVGFRAHIYGWEEAKPYLDMGVKHFFMSQDLRMIIESCQRMGEDMRKVLESIN